MSSPASGPRRADVPTPTPRRLYIHDDLSEELRRHGEGAPAWPLWRALCALLVREPERVVVLTPESQIAALIAGRAHASFETTVAIGAAGAHVAAQVHERTGWFPSVRRVDVWREESADGGYRLAGPPLAFFERPEWMAAWFPGDAPAVVAACRALHDRLEADALARR